jgi:hypothetical protein
MMNSFQAAGLALAIGAAAVSAVTAQSSLVDLMARHGVEVRPGKLDVAFDAHVTPTVPPTSGSFAIPLAILSSTTGPERVDAAYAFGILAGRSGRAVPPQELAAAGQSLIQMIHSEDRRSRVAGARVSGRLFAAPFDTSPRPALPPGLIDALFTVLNQDAEVEQLAAMDALGLVREVRAVTSLTERYRYYRDIRKRALAGGALEALARIGDASSVELARQLAGDAWADGRDATALACAFARERLLRDGSIAIIQQALDDKSRRDQARGYLAELGATVP